MDFSFSSLFCGFVFGVIGAWMIRDGKGKGNAIRICIGLALIVYPYFISTDWLMWAIGVALCGAAYMLR